MSIELPDLPALAVIGLTLLITAVYWKLLGWSGERRTRRLTRALAAQHLRPSEPAARALRIRLGCSDLPFFQQDPALARPDHIFCGRHGDWQVAILDYQFVAPAGAPDEMTVFYARSESARLPRFMAGPSGDVLDIPDPSFDWRYAFRDKVDVARFAPRRVLLPGRPEFNDRFYLRGDDPDAVGRLFGEPLVEFCRSQRRLCMEGGDGEFVLFYWMRRPMPPHLVSALCRYGIELLDRCGEVGNFDWTTEPVAALVSGCASRPGTSTGCEPGWTSCCTGWARVNRMWSGSRSSSSATNSSPTTSSKPKATARRSGARRRGTAWQC